MPTFRPVALPAYPGFPPPPGYIEKVHHNRGLVGVGALVLGVTYALGVGAAASTGFADQSGWAVVPIAGPFIAAGQRDLTCNQAGDPLAAIRRCQQESLTDATAVAILVGVGIGQLLGTALLMAGVLDRQRVWLRSDLVAFQVDAGPGHGFLRVAGRF